MYKAQKSYTLARFEPTIYCSDGGDDDHYTTPPRRTGANVTEVVIFLMPINVIFDSKHYGTVINKYILYACMYV
jgi:hypothetical protein